uniref:VWFA domain-containing protein n=1 Tax=Trichuris muris TaxID=70415 RepID=A0A5S6Q9N0_TRIMR
MNGKGKYVDAEELVFALPKSHLKPFALVRWYLRNLLQTFRPTNSSDTDNSELYWAVPIGFDHYRLVPSTVVHVFSPDCTVVFVLDCSTSASVASADKDCVILDRVYGAFRDALLKLTQPIHAFAHQGICSPRFCITVVAYSSLYCIPGGQVLLQDVSVDSSNVSSLLVDLDQRFKAYLSCLAEVATCKIKCDSVQEELYARSVSAGSTVSIPALDVISFTNDFAACPELLSRPSYEEDGQSSSSSSVADILDHRRSLVPKTDEFCLFDIIRLALLTISDCSDDGPYRLFVITDGVLDLSSNDDLQRLLTHLHLLNVSCSFVQITDGGYESHQAFGRMPSSELLQFVARVTQGRYFLYSTKMNETDMGILNEYQQAAFTVSIPLSSINNHGVTATKLGSHGRFSRAQRLQYCCTVKAGLLSVLDMRLQEGYHIKSVNLSSTTIRIELVRTWKYEVNFFFSIVAAWPIDEKNVTVKWKIEAPSCMFPPLVPKFTTKWPVSSSNDGEFTGFIGKRLVSNRLPVMLAMLNRESLYMTIPEPLRRGLQFNDIRLPPNAVTPESMRKMSSRLGRNFKSPVVCNLEAVRSMEKFRLYWTKLVSLSPILRRKVFHVDRLSFILNHESSALNSFLYLYDDLEQSIICFDEARAAIEDFFLRFSSFSLTKTSCYVKFRTGAEEPVDSFCIIRLLLEEPVVTVELNFSSSFDELGRQELMDDLRTKLSTLQLSRCTPSLTSSIQSNENVDTLIPLRTTSSMFVPACFLINAPLDRLTIRHTSLPLNPVAPFHPDELDEQPLCSGLCRFMKFRRYWWSLKLPGTIYQMETEVANLILHALLRKRLNSGFRVVYSKGGFTTLLQEHKGQDGDTYGLIQYVVYPTVLTDTHFNEAICRSKVNSRTDINGSLTEDDCITLSEVQICTEVWITPAVDNICASSVDVRPSEKLFESVSEQKVTTYP